MKYLFIGGRCDGQRIYLEGAPRFWIVHFVTVPKCDADNSWYLSPRMEYDFEEYEQRAFHIAGVEFVVYTLGHMDLAIVFQRLLAKYENKS